MPGAAVAPPSGSLLFDHHDGSGRCALRPEIVDRVATLADGSKHPALRHAPAAGQRCSVYVDDGQPCHGADASVKSPIAKQYGANTEKRPRRSIATRNRMAQIPLANAATKLAARGSAPTEPMSVTACRASKTPLPAMMITARRKLNSAASTGASPRQSAAVTVDPEREIPGKIATACASPICRAPPAASGSARTFAQRLDQSTSPVTMNAAPIKRSDPNACSNRS